MWILRLLEELGCKSTTPILHQDNQGCIGFSKNPVGHARTKHIDIRHHFMREKVLDHTINVQYCPTEIMAADMLTKPMSSQQLIKLLPIIGIKSIQEKAM
jgi:hypothetical protein